MGSSLNRKAKRNQVHATAKMRKVGIRELWATDRRDGRLYNCLQSDTVRHVTMRGIVQTVQRGDWLVTPHTPLGAIDTQRIIPNYEFESNFLIHSRGPNS